MFEAFAVQPGALVAIKEVLLKGTSYVSVLLLSVFIAVFTARIFSNAYKILFRILSSFAMAFKALFSNIRPSIGNGVEPEPESLEKVIEAAGYKYDQRQDIFYSHLNPWQRNFGYCRLYDEASAAIGIIVDCEPVYFKYNGKKWLIEFWKGQYGMATGCEIGVYSTEGPELNIPGIFNGTFYNCASDEEMLNMSCSLFKSGKTLFVRKDRHWWLTGFILGEFSEPFELTMHINIEFKDRVMCDAFIKGLKDTGYSEGEITRKRKSVSLIFAEPRSAQPYMRTSTTDWIMQRKNKFLCDKFQYLTKAFDNLPDKIKAIKEKDPDLYEKVINIGKTKQVFEIYETIEKYLD